MSNAKVELSLYWPERMLVEMKDQGYRLDKSISWCVQRAWKLACVEIAALPARAEPGPIDAAYAARYESPASNVRKQTLFLTEDVARAVEAEALRLDRANSWVLQRAWCLALAEIEKLVPDE